MKPLDKEIYQIIKSKLMNLYKDALRYAIWGKAMRKFVTIRRIKLYPCVIG